MFMMQQKQNLCATTDSPESLIGYVWKFIFKLLIDNIHGDERVEA